MVAAILPSSIVVFAEPPFGDVDAPWKPSNWVDAEPM
jgi:hypothetical protein